MVSVDVKHHVYVYNYLACFSVVDIGDDGGGEGGGGAVVVVEFSFYTKSLLVLTSCKPHKGHIAIYKPLPYTNPHTQKPFSHVNLL